MSSHPVMLLGASGRMGTAIRANFGHFPALRLQAAVVSPQSPVVGNAAGAGILFTSDLESGIRESEVVIDFSTPKATLRAIEVCRAQQKPLLIGTTGFSDGELRDLKQAAQSIPVLFAPNTSRGLHALRALVRVGRAVLPGYDAEIVELHHRGKRDAPSGTALSLAAVLSAAVPSARLDVVAGRGSEHGSREPTELGISSLRGGDSPGEHTVFFLGEGERVEITHRVSDRGIFARGALELGALLIAKSPGWYEVGDLFGT